MKMVEFKKLIEVTTQELKAGKEVSFDSAEFRKKVSGAKVSGAKVSGAKVASDGDGAREPAFCRQIDTMATDYFRGVCQGKQKTIRGIADSSNPNTCTPAEIPYLKPSLTLRWGDSASDQLETEDIETFCLTARNPYSNVTFDSFQISTTFLLDPNWQIPPSNNLDGTPSSKFTPAHNICFGDLGPCGSASREVQLVNRNALPGRFFWIVVFCVNWSVRQENWEFFPLDYVPS